MILRFSKEGISFDSALNFFTEDQIKNGKRNYYKNKEFTPVEINGLPFLKLTIQLISSTKQTIEIIKFTE